MGSLEDKLELIQNARVGILRTRISDGLILMANNWIAQFLGYESADEVIGHVSVYDHYIQPEFRQHLLEAFIGNEVGDYQLRLKRTDDSIVWFSYSGVIFPEKDYIDGCMIDITARYEMERVMKENEAFHTMLFNNSYSVILILDAQTGEIVTANPAAEAFYGYSLESLQNMTVDQLATVPREELLQILSQATEAGTIDYFQHRTAGGEIKEVEARWGLVYINGRKLVFTIINDITEHKRWEKSLCESEQKLAEIIDFLPDATFVIDLQGRVITWNRAAENLTGIPAEDILGKGNYEYVLPFYGERRPMLIDLVIHPENQADAHYPFMLWDENSLVGEDFCPFIGKNGAYMWGKASPIYDAQGKIIGAIESVRDVTLRKTVELNKEKELNKFRVLYDLAVAMTAENTLEENLTLVVEKSRELMGTETAFIALRDEQQGYVYMHTTSGVLTDGIKNLRLPFGVGVGGLVAESGKGIIIDNYLGSPEISHEVDIPVSEEGLISGMAVPIQMGKKNLGVLYAYNRRKTAFTTMDLEALALLGNLAAVEISRRYTEAELLESRQQMADIISFLPDATFSINCDGIVTTWNKAAEELTGVKAGDIVGKGERAQGEAFYCEKRPTLADLVLLPEENADIDYEKFRRDEGALVGENFCPAVGEKGAILWGKASCLYDSHGNLVGAIESVRDITESKMAEQAYRESEQRLADIFDFLPDPTLVIDKEGKVLAWNRAIEEMTGVPASEMLGKGDYEYAIPFYGVRQPILIDLVFANNPEVEKAYFFIQRDKEAIVAETPTPCVKGQRRFLWGKATPLYNSRGEVVGAIESIRDVTQRREYEEALQESNKRLEMILGGIVEALGATAEKRDPYTAGHQRRVARLAVSIARVMELPEEQLRNIQIAASLHDIGKMYIPAEILSKPGELTDIERMLVKSHPQAGFDIVKSIPFTEPIANILIQHHERIDGSGYPKGIKGEEILPEAKIIAVADVVEAMSSHRPYRPAFGVDKALNEIVKNKGRLYEPLVVDACVRVFMETGFILE